MIMISSCAQNLALNFDPIRLGPAHFRWQEREISRKSLGINASAVVADDGYVSPVSLRTNIMRRSR